MHLGLAPFSLSDFGTTYCLSDGMDHGLEPMYPSSRGRGGRGRDRDRRCAAARPRQGAWHGVRCLERLVNQVAAAQCDRTCHCYRCDLPCCQRGRAHSAGRRGRHRRPRKPLPGLFYSGRLAEKFDFIKEPLKVDDMLDITAKLKFQPSPVSVLRHDVFPAA